MHVAEKLHEFLLLMWLHYNYLRDASFTISDLFHNNCWRACYRMRNGIPNKSVQVLAHTVAIVLSIPSFDFQSNRCIFWLISIKNAE